MFDFQITWKLWQTRAIGKVCALPKNRTGSIRHTPDPQIYMRPRSAGSAGNTVLGSWSSNQMLLVCKVLKIAGFQEPVLFFVVIQVATVLLVLYCIASSLRKHFLTDLPHFFISPWQLHNKNLKGMLLRHTLHFRYFQFLKNFDMKYC